MALDLISCKEIAPPECMHLPSTAGFLGTHFRPSLGKLQGSVFVTCQARILLESRWFVPSAVLLVEDDQL